MDSINLDYLITSCAVDRDIISAIIKVESSGYPWVINDNTTKKILRFSTQDEVTEKANELLNKGHNLDLGLSQINSSNLKKLNLSVEQVIEPCTNLKAAASIFNNFYKIASLKFKDKDQTLFHTLSAYNTGSFYKGYKYAEKVFKLINIESKDIKYNVITPYNASIMVEW